MQRSRNHLECIEQAWIYKCIDQCLYQVTFFFIFCKDDSKMLKAFDFFHDVLQRNVTAVTPPPPPPPNGHMTFIVDIIDMRGFPYSTHYLEKADALVCNPDFPNLPQMLTKRLQRIVIYVIVIVMVIYS
jgi:hypothetical protein